MFKSTASDDSVYVTTNPDPSAYAALGTHVDDMPTIGTSAGIDQVRAVLSDKFDITEKNLGDEGVIMGVQYLRDRQNRRLKLHQTASAEELLAANNMTDCKGVNTPIDPGMAKAMMLLPTDDPDPVARRNYQSLVGCLMWLLKTRPDIYFLVSFLSRFLQNATQKHLDFARGRPLRFLRQTTSYGIVFCAGKGDWILSGASDADLAGDLKTARSTLGHYLI
jgi:hypothetical protein